MQQHTKPFHRNPMKTARDKIIYNHGSNIGMSTIYKHNFTVRAYFLLLIDCADRYPVEKAA
jgi:hypothetical protein